MIEKLRPSWDKLKSENCLVGMTLLFCSKDLKWHFFSPLFSVLCSLTKVTLYFLAPDFSLLFVGSYKPSLEVLC